MPLEQEETLLLLIDQKMKGPQKWLDRLTNAHERLSGKVAKELPAIFGAILSFLNNSVEYVAKHTYALIVFAAGLIGVWMIQKVLG